MWFDLGIKKINQTRVYQVAVFFKNQSGFALLRSGYVFAQDKSNQWWEFV